MKGKSNGKIGIITYYQTDNYGANLQAFAMLQLFNGSALVKYNGKNISRRNYQKMIAFLKKSDSLVQCFSVVINSIYTRICFSLFRRKHLMFCNAEECTSFILGADQIWNTEINKGDLFFFQNFSNAKTFAYAASFGYDSFPKSYEKLIGPLLKRMDIIGVREISGKRILSNQFHIDSIIVLDPVFLVPTGVWKEYYKLEEIEAKKGFVFYQREINTIPTDMLKKMYPDVTFEIYSNSPIKYNKVRKIRCGGINDWLLHIYNAPIIITTSYHAIVFSILFHKQFVFAKFRSARYCSRIENLFILLKIPYEVLEISNIENWVIPSLDYSDIDKELELLKMQSYSLIEDIKRRIV